MPQGVDQKNRGRRYPTYEKKLPVGIVQYQLMVDTPTFVIARDGSFYQLDRFSSFQLPRLDFRV
ncbi:hypothetical protein OAK26_00225 [Gammaproteobacteria bacterium]|jgi:hypothetical protein|nr:hypothetical protein [Gammaproteobacteria bacterium]